MARAALLILLWLIGCKPDIERATGSVGVGSGYGPGSGSGGAGGVGGAGGAAGAGGGACQTDSQCQPGQEWCVGGSCVPCDNTGAVCDISCPAGWTTYERNGCQACACAPTNECTADGDCGGVMQCYAGNFCWDWCPANDSSCCFGNTCDVAGCGPNPTGCVVTGCPAGQTCIESGCTSSLCQCDGATWLCGSDCLGGTCT